MGFLRNLSLHHAHLHQTALFLKTQGLAIPVDRSGPFPSIGVAPPKRQQGHASAQHRSGEPSGCSGVGGVSKHVA